MKKKMMITIFSRKRESVKREKTVFLLECLNPGPDLSIARPILVNLESPETTPSKGLGKILLTTCCQKMKKVSVLSIPEAKKEVFWGDTATKNS
jgi:hypothetical protein